MSALVVFSMKSSENVPLLSVLVELLVTQHWSSMELVNDVWMLDLLRTTRGKAHDRPRVIQVSLVKQDTVVRIVAIQFPQLIGGFGGRFPAQQHVRWMWYWPWYSKTCIWRFCDIRNRIRRPSYSCLRTGGLSNTGWTSGSVLISAAKVVVSGTFLTVVTCVVDPRRVYWLSHAPIPPTSGSYLQLC